MPDPIKLYHSQVHISSQRRRAPRIDPSIARMYDTGAVLSRVGEALFGLGLKLDQINKTRQVTNALNEYKKRINKFKRDMERADPTQINFDDAWTDFVNAQADLTNNLPGDVADVIQEKLELYQSSDYNELKKIEIANTTRLVKAEAPNIMAMIAQEQVKATLAGNEDAAREAQQQFTEYIKGVAPAMRPGDPEKLIAMYNSLLEKSLVDGEEQLVFSLLMQEKYGQAAKKIQDMKYSTPERQLQLMNKIPDELWKKKKLNRLQKTRVLEAEATTVVDEYIETGDVAPNANLQNEIKEYVEMVSHNVADELNDVLSPEQVVAYQDMLRKVDISSRYANQSITLTNMELLKAMAQGLSSEQIATLRQISNENRILEPKRREIRAMLVNIHRDMDDAQEAILACDDCGDVDVLMDVIDEERQATMQIARQRALDGEEIWKIRDSMNKAFANENIIERGFFKYKPGIRKFKPGIQEAEENEQKRRQAIIALLLDDPTGREQAAIKAAVKAGWFD